MDSSLILADLREQFGANKAVLYAEEFATAPNHQRDLHPEITRHFAGTLHQSGRTLGCVDLRCSRLACRKRARGRSIKAEQASGSIDP